MAATHNLKNAGKGGTSWSSRLPPRPLTLFLKGKSTPPGRRTWASRLIQEANARLLVDERDLWAKSSVRNRTFDVRTPFLREHPDVVKNWLRAHVELTEWINANPRKQNKSSISKFRRTRQGASAESAGRIFSRLQATYDPIRSSLLTAHSRPTMRDFWGVNVLTSLASTICSLERVLLERSEAHPMI